MKYPHAIYAPHIIRATGCMIKESIAIEEVMRAHFGTLDHLSPKEFAEEARLGLGALRMHQDDPSITWCLGCDEERSACVCASTMQPRRAS